MFSLVGMFIQNLLRFVSGLSVIVSIHSEEP